MTAWQYTHIGIGGDYATIHGLRVWKHKWRQVSTETVALPHPTHPTQIHDYRIYEIGDSLRPVRFAAAELSNNVWGFYIQP
jgi:hypothetical protein